eukprot:CAMPEP_0204911690 /NCGR_PEP_ID=MMETSP1397-20131031/9985_1 /ASSEMBLY_ACC=CAM_ASM_000891 /TAXON_ID=49980 /ORGANISM="Climacostomum Climacostomum virens, Strain Stock W-24" /LENGTH=216 /DNA_ID=CAMNT_0052082337 /DNA_START=591 /DNA_END=1237 /DNA_ORIENTATION=-
MFHRDIDLVADMACCLSKKGLPLTEVAQTVEMPPDAVLDLIARRTELSVQDVQVVFKSMEEGLSIDEMPTSFPLEALSLFVPARKFILTQTELSKYYKAEIKRRSREGFNVSQIANYLGYSEAVIEEVLASDDNESVTESEPSTAMADFPLRNPVEEFKPSTEVPRPAQARWMFEGVECPEFIYSYKRNTSVLCRTNLSTGTASLHTVKNHTFSFG